MSYAGNAMREADRAYYLVTGGAGFIGSALVRSLREKFPDRRVVVVDNVHVQTRTSGASGGRRARAKTWVTMSMSMSITLSIRLRRPGSIYL